MTITFTLPEKLPKLIVLDLDYTIWPVFMDHTHGPPFKYNRERNEITDRIGKKIPLYSDITAILALISTFPNPKIAIASRTSIPEWAEEALALFTVPELDHRVLNSMIDPIIIFPNDRKTVHFKALHEMTGIAYDDMIFFDDYAVNREVTKLGVHFILVTQKEGLTMPIFQKSLETFAEISTAGST